jgi:two-component system, OmpR family, KDP operon response regulator KdpE
MILAKILLIGDEPNILRTLRRNLVGRGYDVEIALDDQETFEMVFLAGFDLYILILDFTTVKVNGLDICARLRKISQAPIIVLSSIGSEKTKIKALDLGADDYLDMPFSMEEFLARVRSSLRRWQLTTQENNNERLFLCKDLVIDSETRQVTIRGDQIRLTPTEYDLLFYLAKRVGKVVTHRELLKEVWGAEYGEEREYLRVFISQIRRKIEEDPMRPQYVITEPGVGYRFAPDN